LSTAAVRLFRLQRVFACGHRQCPAERARETFPDVPLYGMLEGLHLAGAAMERLIPDTMAHLQQFALPQIMPAHCTGRRALWALLNTLGESVVTPCTVGSRFMF
jgi:7,8-dihydropterin-6-yl-methyl-4-(beta-D-ribofuranosyl)aminobenzene 5'-phosphate synthase